LEQRALRKSFHLLVRCCATTGLQDEQHHLHRWFGSRRHVCAQHVWTALMTLVDTPSATIADESDLRSGSYVDWSCALGGATLAAAMSSLLLAFGSGLGLSLLSPWPAERLNTTLFGIIMIVWTVFVPLLSFAIGGYFAGRMRRPWQNLATDEVAFRDAAHGALVWAASVVIGAAVLAAVASGSASLTNVQGPSRMIDDMFRTDKPIDASMRESREEAQRMVGTTGTITLSTPDQTYLSGLVARTTGLPEAEATQRVADVLQQARSSAETARKAGIVAAFFTAATLLMGLAVAWFAARKGGEDRDSLTIRHRR
jgi:hypothetical protein